jgi:hypothetical protein
MNALPPIRLPFECRQSAIATVNITSGTIKVVLSDNGANGTWILANAMRVALA